MNKVRAMYLKSAFACAVVYFSVQYHANADFINSISGVEIFRVSNGVNSFNDFDGAGDSGIITRLSWIDTLADNSSDEIHVGLNIFSFSGTKYWQDVPIEVYDDDPYKSLNLIVTPDIGVPKRISIRFGRAVFNGVPHTFLLKCFLDFDRPKNWGPANVDCWIYYMIKETSTDQYIFRRHEKYTSKEKYDDAESAILHELTMFE